MFNQKRSWSFGLFLLFTLILMTMNLFENFWTPSTTIFSISMMKCSSTFTFYVGSDIYTSIFSCTVAIISLSVCLFSFFYMESEKNFFRFMAILSLFILSMLILIHSGNLPSILIGWDGLGVSSFLLVIFFQSQKSFGAGMITAITNRIGDSLIILSSWFFFGDMNGFFWNLTFSKELKMIIFLLILSTLTKSAQFPFSSWLPAAMAAPTPVSALVHSSTLVTAGVYLSWRLTQMSPEVYAPGVFLVAGMVTSVMASMSAMVEPDLKKIVALSTLSQLGLMFIMLGVKSYDLCFIHLIVHAFLKALMFLVVGNVIHNSLDYQSFSAASLSSGFSKISWSILLGANLSLVAFPFMGAFFSKDLFIESFFNKTSFNFWMFLILMLTAVMTMAYTFRILENLLKPYPSSFAISDSYETSNTFFQAVVPLFIAMLFMNQGVGNFVFSQSAYVIIPSKFKAIFFTSLLMSVVILQKLSTTTYQNFSNFHLWELKETGVLFNRKVSLMITEKHSTADKCFTSNLLVLLNPKMKNILSFNYSSFLLSLALLGSMFI